MPSVIFLIVALPLLSALATLLFGQNRRLRISRISAGFLTLTWVLASIHLWQAINGAVPFGPVSILGWAVFLNDPLGALMSWVIAGFALIVHLYSRRYIAEERGYARFFILLNLMTAALLAMVLTNDLVLLVVAWHLVGVLLYLLLGFDLSSRQSNAYAIWTFVTFRLGDLPLVLAAGLLFQAYGTWSLVDIFAALQADPAGAEVLDLPLAKVVGVLIALSAFARSAQLIAHYWLPYTMDGPTPVSALMHAGIVNAGGFIINRFAPVFVHAGEALHLMILVGLATAVIGSVLMLTQHDIKKSLGYSTMGQMGFMIMECGLGSFSLAIYHLIAHGVFKGTLFLGSGGVIGAARRDDGVPPEPLYTFVVKRQIARQRRPWLAMAALTIIVPAVFLYAIHYVVDEKYFDKQGAIVLLFFGWMSGAQLIFATHHMRAENPLRLFMTILFSFAVVVLGYVLIVDVFESFLYPDPAFRSAIYSAAEFRLVQFEILVGLMTAVFVLVWVYAYYAERRRVIGLDTIARWRRLFYRAVGRELYFGELMRMAGDALIGTARRVNILLGGR